MELWAAIDIRNGKSVRLVQGDFSRETIYGDPVERAVELMEGGARRIHVVDLDAAAGHASNRGMVAKIVAAADGREAQIQVGGGVRDEAAVAELVDLGVSRIVMGTAALADPELVAHLAAIHPTTMVIGLDYRRQSRAPSGRLKPSGSLAEMMLATEGWVSGGTVCMEDALAWFEGTEIAGAVVTDIGRDGTLSGPDLDSLAEIVANTEIPVIASGGVSRLEDLAALCEIEAGERRLAGVVVGKALVEGRFSLSEALGVCR